jgi:hypothetical protein
MKKPISTWQELEDRTLQALKVRASTAPVMCGRFSDSKAAGNLIASQPSDFWVLNKGNLVFIETKFSEAAESLKSVFGSAVPDHQLASARLSRRAGGMYWFLFHSSLSGIFELWDGAYLATARKHRERLNLLRRVICTSLDDAIDQSLKPTSGDIDG